MYGHMLSQGERMMLLLNKGLIFLAVFVQVVFNITLSCCAWSGKKGKVLLALNSYLGAKDGV